MLQNNIQYALQIISTPKTVVVRGKNIPPAMLFSSSLTEPLVHWLSYSMGQRLLSNASSWGELIAEPEHLMGMKWAPPPELSINERISEHGMASKLLIVAESLSQILVPAIEDPTFDYADLLITFRDAVDYHYPPGHIVVPEDINLHKILYNKLHATKWQSPNPAMVIPGSV